MHWVNKDFTCCHALGSVKSVASTTYALCTNLEFSELKLKFWKLSILFFKTHNTCANQTWINKCWQDIPVLMGDGGTCAELCQHAKQTFNCTCAYFGKVCEKKSTTPSKQLQLEAKKRKSSTVYTLYDSPSKSFYQTFCDFTEFVWTLLESFSLAKKVCKSQRLLRNR